ncbi:MAG: hypothetical protein IJ390_03280 [Lachnospiraceae bacterium]|nr:hypothetical protein [Lachnospiraceae bacterium]
MLYKKNAAKQLDQELFRNPTAEYRGTPFWAWNCKLEQKELEWQLEILKKMGFGGAHMHVRTGMATPYLSNEYMELIKACVQKAKSEEMLAWLYDEDRWPSGAAGGLVTKEKRYRSRYLLFTPVPYEAGKNVEKVEISSARAGRAENGTLLNCYDVELDEEGYLKSWRVIGKEDAAQFEKWYAYLEIATESPWYNNQTYVNTLDKAAMDRFIEITYESYNRTIAEEFDNTVPAIFTDEPQFTHKSTLKFAKEKADVTLPWTDDLVETYAAAYEGEDLLSGVPELIWDRADRVPSVVRYHYHDHVCERFARAFADNCGNWCQEHGLSLTGHMMEEPTLRSQTAALGEAMRSYRSFGLPGIDMLCAHFEYTTAKQAQSAVHQYGREGMLSELYGVTNWDFDFRGHKLHGDWQAALGVTVRVPHLSWVSMAGEAKRDYPASINYQSPWWDQYSLVEDHFARVNTALTRGKPVVKVGVIHPVESYWLHWGPAEQTALVRDNMDRNFQEMTKWLLFGGIDFDFISESLLPDLCKEAGAPLQVGEMAYDVILVPGCETLRSTTLDRLEAFAEAGGNLIIAGAAPVLEDARESERGKRLAQKALCVPFNRGALLDALEPVRTVEIRNQTGALTENLLYQMRQDGEGRWLFVAHGTEPYNKDVSQYQDLRIRVAGKWKVVLYNTMTGEKKAISYCVEGENTCISRRMYDYDSLLLWLEPADMAVQPADVAAQPADVAAQISDSPARTEKRLKLPVTVPYTLSEPNALLLDQAEYALDDGPWKPEEEILRLDNDCREQLGWPSRKESVAQPWVIAEEPITHTVHLRWHIHSEIEYEGAQLAIEDAERVSLKWNGEPVENAVVGWYVDKSIKTVNLPPIQIGENVLEASIPFGKRTDVEWAYLLGDFGVEAAGRSVRIVPLRKELAFGSITAQGLPFYGGNITYHVPVETEGGSLRIRSSQYKGALQSVKLDNRAEIPVIYPPYTVTLEDVSAGKHMIDFKLYGHRRNGFGPVHLTDLKANWIGPNAWRTEGELWCYDYMICEEGIMTTPEIAVEPVFEQRKE